MIKTVTLGRSILVQMGGCSANLNNIKGLIAVLKKVVEAMKTQIFMGPFVCTFPKTDGLSGLVVIGKSHIAVNTWPELRAATLDIFTCDNSDCQVAVEILLEHFEVERIEQNTVPRKIPTSEGYPFHV